ncbi:MAG: endonuclease/exonuclease/phosphatase family protein [Solirubrobacteraceae bacterium]
MRLITWNVARRAERLAEQATALAARKPDVVALQEVTRRTEPLWTRAFELLGLVHVRSAWTGAERTPVGTQRPAMWVMVASRAPITDVATPLVVPRPESAVAGAIETDLGPVEVYCVHVPNAANGWVKVRTLEAIRAGLESATPGARVLCGDLNTPRRELPSGETISFARDTRGRLRPERGTEWDMAELGVVPGLRELGYVDAFRTLHGYGAREPSWTWRRISGHSGGWRLDHIFASSALRPLACQYHHGWREQDLSDHSALEVDFACQLPS